MTLVSASKTKAFTLAEVLITLAIIGVVAALTIPSVVRNIQAQQLKTQFKKTWSSLEQSLNKTAVLDFGGEVECYVDYKGRYTEGQCLEFWDTFASNLKVTKKCVANAKAGGCIPQYSKYNDTYCLGFSEVNMNTSNVVWVLADGSLLIKYSTPIYKTSIFAIDINGKKKPNKPGYDLFTAGITKGNNGVIKFNLQRGCDYYDEGGKTTLEMYKYSFGS